MTIPRFPLVLAGAAATLAIAIVPQFAHKPHSDWQAMGAAALVAYAIGLGLGWLAFGRRG